MRDILSAMRLSSDSLHKGDKMKDETLVWIIREAFFGAVIVGFILVLLSLGGCSTLTPQSVIKIYPPDEKGVKRIVIDQSRLGKTSYKDKEMEASYDSKGKSLLVGATETINKIGEVIVLDKILGN
jgi:hypothetical protein